jgi:hypothetical protein
MAMTKFSYFAMVNWLRLKFKKDVMSKEGIRRIAAGFNPTTEDVNPSCPL